MKIIILSFLLLTSTLMYAKDDTCRVRIFRTEYITEHFSRTLPKLLKDKNFITDSRRPEFEIRLGVACKGGCSTPIRNPDELSLRVRRVSDGKILQKEDAFRIGYGAGSSWYPSRLQTVKKLFSCEELRAL